MPQARRSANPGVLVLVIAALVASCSSTGSTGSSPSDPAPSNGQSGPAGSVPGAACPTAAAPSDLSAWGQPPASPTLIPVLVTNYVGCGKARILFLYLDAANKVASAPDRSANVAFYNLGRDPKAVAATAVGAFVWTIEGERGMYILNVDLPEAGVWGAEFTTVAPGAAAETVRLSFDVHADSPTVAVGDAAPTSDTPTLGDVGGDVGRISTDSDPNPAFYSTSVADAIADHEPFILIFATPKFCASAQCGPTLDRVKAMAGAHPGITFINVEPYKLQEVDGQLQPLLDAAGSLQAADATNEWGLLTEPWIFAVDGAGIIRGSYELTVTDVELEAVLAEIKPGG